MRLAFALILSLPLAAQSVLTGGGGIARTQAYTNETTLTQANVATPNFKMLGFFFCGGNVNAQPLIVNGANFGGATNVLIVSTIGSTATGSGGGNLCAFNADLPGSAPLWTTNLCTPLASGDPPAGALPTPVIDVANGFVYPECASSTGVHKLYQVVLTTGVINASVTLACTTGSTWIGADQKIRSPLLQIGSSIYIAAAAGTVGNEDTNRSGGYVFQVSASTMTITNCIGLNPSAVNGTTVVGPGGLWGNGMASDGTNIYAVTGNGQWDGSVNWGDSMLKMSASLAITDSSTPVNWSTSINAHDLDLNSDGPIWINSISALIWGGKDGRIFVGGTGGLQGSGGTVTQTLATGLGSSTAANWNVNYIFNPDTGCLYYGGLGTVISSFCLSGGTFGAASASTVATFPQQGLHMAYSSNSGASGTGILWAWAASANLGGAGSYTTPGTLIPYDPVALTPLSAGVQCICTVSKFVGPTIANGNVYVSTSSTQGVAVFGLAPTATAIAP